MNERTHDAPVNQRATLAPGGIAKRERGLPVMHTAWPLSCAAVAVVASFSMSLAFSHFRMKPLENQTDDILHDAVPSLEYLASVRTELLRIGMYANEELSRSSNGETGSRELITASRGRLNTALAAYAALPNFPGEPKHASEIARELALMDDALKNALDGSERGTVAARLVSQDNFHKRLARADDAIERVVALNTRQTFETTTTILETKRNAAAIAILLGGTNVVVVGLTSILAFFTLRKQARLLEEHGRLESARATELEAFAGRVAHDLRNPLGALSMRIQLSQGRDELTRPLLDNLDGVARQVERMSAIAHSLVPEMRKDA